LQLPNVAVETRKIGRAHFGAAGDYVRALDNRHIMPAREINTAVAGEQAGKALAIKRHLFEGVAHEPFEQLPLMVQEACRG
jgi:hypothetical protein